MRRLTPLLLSASVAGCLGTSEVKESTPDGGQPDAGDVPEPAAPVLTPCPEGWAEVADPSEPGIVTCEPWSAGPLECGDDEAQFPGESVCARVGSPCPSGDFADELPEGRVVYVRADKPDGGDGSLENPFGTIADGMDAAEDGDVVALSMGTFDEVIDVRKPVTLWGACVGGTTLAVSDRLVSEATISFWSTSGGAKLGNVTLSGERVGISVQRNMEPVEIESVVLSETLVTGIVVFGEGSLVARDVVVRDSRPLSGDYGTGIEVSGGARLELRRVVVERCSTAGVVAGEAGTELDAEDVVVRDTQARDLDGDKGNGIAIAVGATATLRRIVLEGNATSALAVSDAGTSVILEDLVARDTRARESDGLLGFGLNVFDGARVDVSRALFERNEALGLSVAVVGTELVGRDLVSRDTQGRVLTGRAGYGLQGIDGATITLSRAAFLRNRGAGLFFSRPGTRGTLEDILTVGTLESRCADTTCPDSGWGVGVLSTIGAGVDVRRFRISTAALCGVQVVEGAGMDLHLGEISHNPIGANVQIEEYDLERLRDGVAFVENERTLDATSLPVPEPVEGF